MMTVPTATTDEPEDCSDATTDEPEDNMPPSPEEDIKLDNVGADEPSQDVEQDGEPQEYNEDVEEHLQEMLSGYLSPAI